MLDSFLLDRFKSLSAVRIAERGKAFPMELAQIDATAAATGTFHSGGRLKKVHRAHERELEVRAIIAWESLVRVHRTFGSPLPGTKSRLRRPTVAGGGS